jgi:predicted RNase H-like HicB family nuclease
MKQNQKRNPKIDFFTYRVTWSAEDREHVGLCAELPSLSWLARTPEDALIGIRKVVNAAVKDMESSGEPVPAPLATKHYSGQFRVRIPPCGASLVVNRSGGTGSQSQPPRQRQALRIARAN